MFGWERSENVIEYPNGSHSSLTKLHESFHPPKRARLHFHLKLSNHLTRYINGKLSPVLAAIINNPQINFPWGLLSSRSGDSKAQNFPLGEGKSTHSLARSVLTRETFLFISLHRNLHRISITRSSPERFLSRSFPPTKMRKLLRPRRKIIFWINYYDKFAAIALDD